MSGNRRQVWLKPNRRALLFALVFPLLLAAAACWTGWWSEGWLRWLSMALAGSSLALALALACHAARPRIALSDERLLVFLTWGAPLAVPLSIVECVFLGRPETQQSMGHTSRMVSLVIRLAEAAPEYRHRAVKPALGRWEDGYITINGAWCEPLTLELARGLNDKLRAAHRQLAAKDPCHNS